MGMLFDKIKSCFLTEFIKHHDKFTMEKLGYGLQMVFALSNYFEPRI